MKNIFLGLPEATSDMLSYAYTKWANPDRDADWWIRTGASYMSTDQGWAWVGSPQVEALKNPNFLKFDVGLKNFFQVSYPTNFDPRNKIIFQLFAKNFSRF